MAKISVVIPTYKKLHLLIQNLEINLHWLHTEEIIVVNDYPGESIAEAMKRFPSVKLIENTTNLGFAGAVNVGIHHASGTYILLLNSDVVLKDESFRNALRLFQDETVFAVSFAQQESHKNIVGRNRIFWNGGFFQHQGLPAGKEIVENGWAEGGSALFDTAKLKELGCFDPIYSPFYWEDIDLSYRAWKHGYKVLFHPHIVVEHHHESTISSYFDKQSVQRIAYRNQLLFTKKNISDRDLKKEHRIAILKMIVRTVLKGNFTFLLAFLSSIKYSIDKGNKHQDAKRTDRDILALF